MRRVAATLFLAVALVLTHGTADVDGQASCRFVLGFASLRDLVGAQKVGTCLEDEHFNLENGNAEQRTSGGLLVWRKIDNFTAFTDGGTTWVNGPNGLQSRPNGERFAWERDPVTSPSAPAVGQAAPAGATGSRTAPAPSVAAAPAPAAAANVQASASTPTATAPPAVTATPAATATAVKTPTPTANPVEARFSEKPDRVDTGNDAEFVVRTNGKKGSCTLLITYRNTPQANLGTVAIDDGRCEWKWTLAPDTRTGTAKAQVTVTGENGTATVEDEFDVRKGDTAFTGDVNVELEIDDIPDDVTVGETFEVVAKANMKKTGSCELIVTWPRVAATSGETKTPDDNGRCSWQMTVPTTITRKGTAIVQVTVRKDATYRTATKEVDVKLP